MTIGTHRPGFVRSYTRHGRIPDLTSVRYLVYTRSLIQPLRTSAQPPLTVYPTYRLRVPCSCSTTTVTFCV